MSLGKIQVEALPYFAIIQAAKPCPLPTNIIHAVLWFYSLGIDRSVTSQEFCLSPTEPTLGMYWKAVGTLPGPLGADEQAMGTTGALWMEKRTDLEQHEPLRPACCRMLSSLFLTSKSQYPRRDGLAKVSVHDRSPAVQGQRRKEMAPFTSLERSIWICVPTKTSHN